MAQILIVDDEPDIVILVQRILQKEGHEIIGAKNGIKALELLKELKPDLILLDIMMPRIDGWETLKLIREQDDLKSLPVAMLTAKMLTPEDAARHDITELLDYIPKPITKDSLTTKVSEILRVLENLSQKKLLLKQEIASGDEISTYEIVSRAENLHRSMLKIFKDMFGAAGTTDYEGLKDAIQTQERSIELFRKRREAIEKRLE
jgi:two-component system, OmpR family, alkaline phosphatase synthesis response regulator PhoP